MLKKIIIVAALILPFTINAQEFKFGHLNKQALVESMPAAQTAQKTLEDLLLSKKQEGEKMEAELRQLYEAYLKEAETLDESTRTARETRLQGQQEALRAFALKAEEELAKKQQDLMLPIEQKINDALQQVGKEQGLIYIFDDQMPLYINKTQSIDVLPMVQKIVNAK